MNAVGIIPARWGSTRFPGKSLASVCGKPLVQWVYERSVAAGKLTSVTVATDDERILEAVKGFGGSAVMTRSDHPSGTDRIAEAVEGSGAEIVVNIQGDEPLIDPALIDELVDVMAANADLDMVTAASVIKSDDELRDASVVKVVCDRAGNALYFSRAVIPADRDGDHGVAAGSYLRHIGLYAYRTGFLGRLVSEPPCALEETEKLEQLRALHIGATIRVLETESTAGGVDVPGDVVRVEQALEALGVVKS